MIKFNLKQLLNERNLSITEFSELTNISRPALSKLASGKTQGVQFETLNKIVETIQNFDNKKTVTLKRDYISATTILHDLLIYIQKNEGYGFKPMELIELPTVNLFDNSVLLFEFDRIGGTRFFDAVNIETSINGDKLTLNTEFKWLSSKDVKYYMKNSKSLRQYAGSVPVTETPEYISMYHLNSNSIEYDSKFIYIYLKSYVDKRKDKFSKFNSFQYSKRYDIDNSFIKLNKEYLNGYEKELDQSDYVLCHYFWDIVNKKDSFIPIQCKRKFEFLNFKSNDVLGKAKHYIFD